jgi:hypothetical protein
VWVEGVLVRVVGWMGGCEGVVLRVGSGLGRGWAVVVRVFFVGVFVFVFF